MLDDTDLSLRSPQHQHEHGDPSLLETLLDLDARIHHRLVDEALRAATDRVVPDVPQRVLDLGAGTGAATFRLSERFPTAEIVALDASRTMTERIAARAATSGHDRVTPIDRPVLDSGIDPGSLDLVWASSVFHELDEPEQVLAELSLLMQRGAVLAIFEMDAPPRVLPDEHDAVERRLRQLARADGPAPRWSGALRSAGFELIDERTVASNQVLSGSGIGGDYARAELLRLALPVSDRLDADDRDLLRRLADPGSGSTTLPRVRIRGSRTLWLARRP